MLPYVVGGECRDGVDDLKMKGLEEGGYLGGVAGAQRGVGEYGIEDGVIRESGGALIKDGGRRKGAGRHGSLSQLCELRSCFYINIQKWFLETLLKWIKKEKKKQNEKPNGRIK